MGNVEFNIPQILSSLNIRTDILNTCVECPSCHKKKAYINTRTGLWDCKSASCDASSGGNIVSFYAFYRGIDKKDAFKELANEKVYCTQSNNTPLPFPEEAEIERNPEDVDKTLRAFLSICPLTDKHKNDLIGRGFEEADINKYLFKSMPPFERVFEICQSLTERGLSLKGIAGFYTAKNNNWMFSVGKGGILIPQFDEQGRIWGIQVRKDDEVLSEGEEKCTWFSSRGKANGTGAHVKVNFACDYRLYTNGKKFPFIPSHKVILTEGGMKADLIHSLQPSWSVISVPGVNAVKCLEKVLQYLKVIGVTDIVHCYDMDYKVNKDVKAAMEKTKNIIIENGMKYHFGEWNTKTDDDIDCLKGLDDFLAYKLKGIVRT